MATAKRTTTANRLPTTVKKRIEKTVEVEKSGRRKSEDGKQTSLSAPVFNLVGKETGSVEMPKEVFGAPVNKQLLAQALRVYLNNQKSHFAHTKTRSEVAGSTRKIYKQKGTGGARHGAKRAPIFVGGGVALGPKYRKTELKLPQKMKSAALVSALSQKMSEKQISVVAGLEKATGKTKEMAKLADGLWRMADSKGSRILIVLDQRLENAKRAGRNIPEIEMISAGDLNAYAVVETQSLMLTKEAIDLIVKRVIEGAASAKATASQAKNA